MTEKKHAIVVGAGFGGLAVARKLANQPDLLVTVIDRHNHHLFQPLLYQVAIAGLEAPQIAEPVRSILSHYPNERFRMGVVQHVDLERRQIQVDDRRLRYDYLVIATGSRTAQLGVPGVDEYAYEMKQLTQAMRIRDQVLSACEAAVRTRDRDQRRKLLSFIIVGGGPTGIELAGALAELRRKVVPHDYPELDVEDFQVIVVESSPHPLASLPEDLQLYAERTLIDSLGVQIHSNSRVSEVLEDGVRTESGTFIPGYSIIWTAGVQGVVISGLPEPGRGKRIETTPELCLADHPEVFVIGDVNGAEDPETDRAYPQVAPMAIQQGSLAGENILADLRGRSPQSFHYVDKGTLVTLGRAKAVADVYGLRFRGLLAWFTWLAVHLVQLVGFRNRVQVMMSWIYSYITYDFAVRIMYRRRKFPTGS